MALGLFCDDSLIVKYFIIDVVNNRPLDVPPAERVENSFSDRISFSKSGRWILFGNRIFDRTTKTISKISGCPEKPKFFETSSINLNRLIIRCGDGTLKFWSLASGQEVLSMKAHSAEVIDSILMKDNNYLLTSDGSKIKLWKTSFK